MAKFLVLNESVSSNIIAAEDGFKIRILSILFTFRSASGNNNLKFRSGETGTNLSGLYRSLYAPDVSLADDYAGVMETSNGEPFWINIGSVGIEPQVRGHLSYEYVAMGDVA